jgi:hypothetical protein
LFARYSASVEENLIICYFDDAASTFIERAMEAIMSLLHSIQQKTAQVSKRANSRFRIEVDQYIKRKPTSLEGYSHYAAYLFEEGHKNPYPLFAVDSQTGKDYPAEMRIADERGIAPIQINSSDELLSNLDMILQEDFLKKHVRTVSRRPQFERQ